MKWIFDVEDLSVSWRAQSNTSENDWGEVYSSMLQNTHTCARTHTKPHPLITIPRKYTRHFMADYWMKRSSLWRLEAVQSDPGCMLSEAFICLFPLTFLSFFKILHNINHFPSSSSSSSSCLIFTIQAFYSPQVFIKVYATLPWIVRQQQSPYVLYALISSCSCYHKSAELRCSEISFPFVADGGGFKSLVLECHLMVCVWDNLWSQANKKQKSNH